MLFPCTMHNHSFDARKLRMRIMQPRKSMPLMLWRFVAWQLDNHRSTRSRTCAHGVFPNLGYLTNSPAAQAQHVVRQAKRTMESPNKTFKQLKQCCGPRLLERRKRKSAGDPAVYARIRTASTRDIAYNTSISIMCSAYVHPPGGDEESAAPSVPNPDAAETQPQDTQGLHRGMPNPPDVPDTMLFSVLGDLETRTTISFDSTLQHKRRFRAHCSSTGTRDQTCHCMIHMHTCSVHVEMCVCVFDRPDTSLVVPCASHAGGELLEARNAEAHDR